MRETMWSWGYWRSALELAIRGAATGALLAIGADQVNALDADWVKVLGFAAGAGALSLFGSIASTPFGRDASPMLTAAPAPRDAGRAGARTATRILR